MSRHQSPFAALSGAEKQIKWLEYQSIRLPYVVSSIEKPAETTSSTEKAHVHVSENEAYTAPERPQPPPEVPRTMPDFQKTRHSQYDAVIARMKQAELQSRRYQAFSQTPQQMK